MSTQIFVNLPVQDLQRSVDFVTALGYSFDPRFMYSRSLLDPDGHLWEVLSMDTAAMSQPSRQPH